MDAKDRKQIMETFLSILDNISDKEYQKRVWIRGEGPDFTETVCHFFDDGDPILNNYSFYGISEYQLQLLTNFRNTFEFFSDENDIPQLFIDSPEWVKIVEMAKDVLKAFNYTKCA
jgi:hypothetical protein